MLKSGVLRWLTWAAALAALLLVSIWLAVPPLLKWQLETRGAEALGRELRVGKVEFDLFALTLTLKQLSVASAAAGADAQRAPLLKVERLGLDFSARSLWRLAPVLEAVSIDAPQLHLSRLEDGGYDIDDLVQRLTAPAAEPTSSKPQGFALFNLRLSDGQVLFDDRRFGVQHTLRHIVLDLPFLSNLPDDLQVNVEPRLAFELDGSAFSTEGRSTPFAEGRASEFELRLDQLDLAPWWAYLPKTLPAVPQGGTLDAGLTLRFEQPPGGEPKVELAGQVDLHDLVLQLPDGAPLASWKSLRVRLADVQPLRRQVRLESLQVDGARLQLRRDAAGGLRLLHWLQQANAGTGSDGSAAMPPRAAASSVAISPTAGTANEGWSLQLPWLELKDAQLDWHDASVQPAADLALVDLQLRLEQVQWPTVGDAGLKLAARLVAAGRAAGAVTAEGTVSEHQAKMALQLRDIDLAPVQPYFRPFLSPQPSAVLNATGTLDWAGGSTPRLAVALSSARIDDFKLTQPSPAAAGRKAAAPRVLAQWQSLALGDVQADLLRQRVSLGSLSLMQPRIELARDATGALDVMSWFVAGPVVTDEGAESAPDKTPGTAPAAAPWFIELRDFQLDGGRVRLEDAALPAGAMQLDKLRLRAAGLAWPIDAAARPVDTELSATLLVPVARGRAPASTARIDWRGLVGLQPMSASGQLRLERLPVHAFDPYIGARLPVLLQRAEAGYSGRVELRQIGSAWQLGLDGEALIADLRIEARRAAAARSDTARELLSWNALSLKGLKVDLPAQGRPSLHLGEMRLSDYYAQLEITEEGRLYLQTLAPGNADGASPSPSESPVGPRSRLAGLPFDFGWDGAVFNNGRLEFNDRFIRPNYSAVLSELFGRIGAFDSRKLAPATLQFAGVVAGTGVLSIEGAINPAIDPPSLDLQAKATGIELPGLTPYAAKYAGYPIERGKLSVDVRYQIDSEGKLAATNKIVVNQLSFGEKTDSPDATSLPVRLAVALLQDRYGVIDIDLPVSGSINDPQFSVGGLIVKAIVNLLTKVLTAPFALLSGGGGPDLSVIEFAPGSVTIDAQGQAVIDQVAVALADRPALKLSVLGLTDPANEKPALQQAAVQRRLIEEQRLDRARGALGRSSTELDTPLPPLTPEARAELLRRLYRDTALPAKPAGSPGPNANLPADEMAAQLAASVSVDDALMRQLALNRARAVREALLAKGLPSDRLFIAEPDTKVDAADKKQPRAKAQLMLSPL